MQPKEQDVSVWWFWFPPPFVFVRQWSSTSADCLQKLTSTLFSGKLEYKSYADAVMKQWKVMHSNHWIKKRRACDFWQLLWFCCLLRIVRHKSTLAPAQFHNTMTSHLFLSHVGTHLVGSITYSCQVYFAAQLEPWCILLLLFCGKKAHLSGKCFEHSSRGIPRTRATLFHLDSWS